MEREGVLDVGDPTREHMRQMPFIEAMTHFAVLSGVRLFARGYLYILPGSTPKPPAASEMEGVAQSVRLYSHAFQNPSAKKVEYTAFFRI